MAGEAERLQLELARLQVELPAVLNKLAALDATMASLDHSVPPTAAGTVKVQGQHGPRGALKQCVLEQLEAAGRAGVDVSTLALQVATALGVELPTKKDFSAFRRDYVYVVLKRAKADGLAEVLAESPGGQVPSVWRWVGRQAAPSLDELRGLGSGRQALAAQGALSVAGRHDGADGDSHPDAL